MNFRNYFNLMMIAICCASIARAVDTVQVNLQHGEGSDEVVHLRRDNAGNLVLEDAHTSATLSMLRFQAESHGALAGLDGDDHTHYLTGARHESEHDATFNGALAISGDVGSNATLGGHVADGNIHLRGSAASSVSGAWDFTTQLLVRGGLIRLGSAQFSSAPAIRFSDTPFDAEFAYDASADLLSFNRTMVVPTLRLTTLLDGAVSGTPTASISGFTSIEGIDAADLLDASANESVSGAWTFVNGVAALGPVRAPSLVLEGLAPFAQQARNGGEAAIASGTVVAWAGIEEGVPLVVALEDAMTTSTAVAGVALADADEGTLLLVAVGGFATGVAWGNFVAGESVTWNGSAFVAGTPGIGRAMESVTDAEEIILRVIEPHP